MSRRTSLINYIVAAGLPLLCLLGTLVSAPAIAQTKCPLNGTWKSNKPMTLESMNKSARLNAKQREFLSNLMGKMIVQYNCKTVTSTFNGRTDTSGYTIKAMTDNKIRLVFDNPSTKERTETVLTMQGNCYAYPVVLTLPGEKPRDLGFNEYFCRQK